MRWGIDKSRTLAAAAGLTLILSSAGCGEKLIHGKPAERAYLELPAESSLPQAGPSLFPGGVGSRWIYATTETAASSLRPRRAEPEQIVVVGQRRVAGKAGYVWERRQGKGSVSQEIYALGKRGATQLALGRRAEIIIDPPLPILRYPARPGMVLTWEGVLRSGGAAGTPAEAAVRVTRVETVATPAGRFEAFRIDTILRLVRNRRNIDLPTISWYAPGVGLVKQQHRDESRLVVKTLQNYRLK